MSKTLNKRIFGQYAAHYVDSKPHAKGASLQKIIELASPQIDWYALDIATAAGHTALTVAPYVKHVTATDLTPEMIPLAQKSAQERGISNITVEIADGENLQYEDDSFHLVTCRIAPHHFGDIPAFVSETHRVLKETGLLVVVDNIVPPGEAGKFVNVFEKRRDPSHQRCLTLDEWISHFEDAGFEVTAVDSLAKEMDFNSWAGRHPKSIQDELRDLLHNAPPEAKSFLQPSKAADQLTFRLVEGIIVGRKNKQILA